MQKYADSLFNIVKAQTKSVAYSHADLVSKCCPENSELFYEYERLIESLCFEE